MTAGLESWPYLLSALVMAMVVFMPAYVLREHVPGQDALTKVIASSSLTLGGWVCLFYLTSLIGLPMTYVIMAVLFGSFVLIFKRGFSFPRLPKMTRWLGALCFLPYVVGHLSFEMLPGCDTAAHGTIVRLVMEQNGVPGTFRPLLPVEHFGGYSAGFHLITASAACFHSPWLMAGLSATTAVSHLLVVFGLAFLLSLFAPPRTALVVAIVVFWFHRSLQTVVDWGGTPTLLSLGFVLCALAFFGYGLRERSLRYAAMGSCIWSAAALTHLIPAYVGLYMSIGLMAYWAWKVHAGLPFLLRTAGIAAATTLVCLAPFALQWEDQRSPALSTMIWAWQHRMMDDVLTGDLPRDAFRLLGELKFSLSDLTVIAMSTCAGWLLLRRRYRAFGLASGLALLLFVLIMNTGYWTLPFSELLYPERVMYFFVVPCGILMCRTCEDLACIPVMRGPLALPAITTMALAIGCYNCFDRYVDALVHPDRRFDAATREVFHRIAELTAPDAVIHVAYDTEGMWVPAFSYRAAVGTHLHFVHEVLDVKNRMVKAPVDHYVLRRVDDSASVEPKDPLAEMRAIAFSNEQWELILSRRKK